MFLSRVISRFPTRQWFSIGGGFTLFDSANTSQPAPRLLFDSANTSQPAVKLYFDSSNTSQPAA